jgi:L-lactate dehydrogenase complex protein LldG
VSAIPNQSSNIARDAIMQSIRAHLAASPAVDRHHIHNSGNATDAGTGFSPEIVSPVAAFRERLESVGGHCVIVKDEEAAANALAGIISELQDAAKRIALSDAPLVLALTTGITEVTVCPATADLFNYDVGISTAQAGIAETGTLILEGEKERNRLVSLLPPVHIALLNSRDIFPTIGDALTALHQNSLSRAITFITGPSRTADIELTLTVGVHGPKELHVIVIDAPSVA